MMTKSTFTLRAIRSNFQGYYSLVGLVMSHCQLLYLRKDLKVIESGPRDRLAPETDKLSFKVGDS